MSNKYEQVEKMLNIMCHLEAKENELDKYGISITELIPEVYENLNDILYTTIPSFRNLFDSLREVKDYSVEIILFIEDKIESNELHSILSSADGTIITLEDGTKINVNEIPVRDRSLDRIPTANKFEQIEAIQKIVNQLLVFEERLEDIGIHLDELIPEFYDDIDDMFLSIVPGFKEWEGDKTRIMKMNPENVLLIESKIIANELKSLYYSASNVVITLEDGTEIILN